MQKILRELDIDNFDSIQNKLIPYLLVKYPGLYQFWNHVDQTDLFEQIPELLTTIQDIFDSGYFDKIEQAWSTCGLKACSKQCGSFDRMNAQWVERAKT